MNGTKPWVVIVLAMPGLFVAALVALWFWLPTWVLQRIVHTAASHGVELEHCELKLGWQKLTLTGCNFGILNAGEVSGTLERVEIDLVDFEPDHVLVQGARVRVLGTPDFSDWFERQRPDLGRELKVAVEDATLEWRTHVDEPPRVTLTQLNYTAPSGDFTSRISASDVLAGDLSRKGDLVTVALRLVSNPKTRFEARIQQSQALGELRLELDSVKLADLEGPWLKLPDDLKRVELDGLITAEVPLSLDARRPQGDARFTLRGLNFPVPRELQGLIYGTPVELSSRFSLDYAAIRAELQNVRLQVGTLDMRGKGKAELEGSGVGFDLRLSGNLSCDAIVRSAVATHFDSELAKVAGKIAKLALKGSVSIVALVRGRSDALDRAQVVKSVGLGCGLKPLPLPPEFGKLPAEWLDMLPNLPELPSSDRLPAPKITLPKLPELPRFSLPRPGNQERENEP